MSMEQSSGEVAAAKRAESFDAGADGEDRLSALPDDVLVDILLPLGTEDAARTCVLSGRWRRIWTLLPELHFFGARDPHRLQDAVSASDVPLHRLLVVYPDVTPQSLAVWLPVAARRVSGSLLLVNRAPGRRALDDETEVEVEAFHRGTFELPCFEKATSISLHLRFLNLSMPPAGVFAQLTELSLNRVWFHGPGELEDAVSSPRCPCLQKLTIHHVRGLGSITIDSESLQLLHLMDLRGVQQVTIVAPALEDLSLENCFNHDQNRPIANISASQLKSLRWLDAYDPSSVHFGSMKHLQKLVTFFVVYGLHGFTPENNACLMLLPRFKAIEYLRLLFVTPEVNNLQYLMEDMTVLPSVTSLYLTVMATGHAFGACTFHVLRICSGIKQLMLDLSSPFDKEEQSVCSSDCICHQPTNWKTEELSLNCLQELEIEGFGKLEHEIVYMKRLLNWVPVLKTMTVTFNCSVTGSKTKELFLMFQSFSRPGLCMKFYIYQKGLRKVLYAPED